MQRLLAAALAVACVLAPAAAQGTPGSGAGGVPSCVTKLVPCAGYLNDTSAAAPPAACCGPLRDAAANETACLCAMLRNTAALQALGAKPEQGLRLAKRCNAAADASACAATSAAGSSGAATGSSTAASSASTGGSASASSVTKPTASGGSVAHRLSLTGASLLVGSSFMWCLIMA